MLKLEKITKVYETEGFKQKALDNVSVNFRKNEFAAILGPSGSGKTTFLNIIGGLDSYTSGDLIINNVSTKKYKDRDWDTYRNNKIGFVFQSYNLIGHQSVLSNVELALTLSGVSKNARKKKAKEALIKVGLEKHMHKRPNQLSGGQMQRVAIARAVINNPDILLADEPTGALDSEISIQIMEILKDIAKDRLVIMVTHNSEIAEQYATRIIKLKDGHITDDTAPYKIEQESEKSSINKKTKKKSTSMSLLTALSLSLNNLMTKKGRTLLTAFAGSIGIIGIALILSLSNGVQEYINRVEKETLASYPLSIDSTSIDLSAIVPEQDSAEEIVCKENTICTTDNISNNVSLKLATATITNNLKEFKDFLNKNGGNINQYTTDIQYVYNLDLQIYSSNTKNNIIKVNPDTLLLNETKRQMQSNNMFSSTAMTASTNVFKELIGNNALINSQYKILSGRLPKKYNELVLVVNENNQIPLSIMYSLDIENREELTSVIEENNNKKTNMDTLLYSYDKLIGVKYKLILNTDYYQKENNYWIDKSSDIDYMKKIIGSGLDLSIVGIIKTNKDTISAESGFVGYTHELIEYVVNAINKTNIAKEQLLNNKINVLTGLKFDGLSTTYENNLRLLGIAGLDNPSTINIYPKNFTSKNKIEDIIENYNREQKNSNKEDNIIEYTDFVGLLMSSITKIVNVITYILIAFVAISLIVSSIMIAIITYISVLERTKEIGILRAIGASKRDVSTVFNAETIIEGFIAGVMGVGITLLLCIPINVIVNNIFEINKIASLPLYGGIGLVIISVILTVIAGLIPAKMASKKDPVEALRSE